MSDFIGWIKEHKILSAAVAVTIVVLLYAISSSGSSSASTSASTEIDPSTGEPLGSAADASALQAQAAANATSQANQLAANTTLAQGAQQAQTTSDTLAAQLAAVQVQSAAATQQAQLAANVQMQNIVTSGQVALNSNSTQVQLATIQTGGQVQIAGITAAENVQISGQQQGAIVDQAYDALQSEESINNATVQLGAINASTLQSIAQYASQASNPTAASKPVPSTVATNGTPVSTGVNTIAQIDAGNSDVLSGLASGYTNPNPSAGSTAPPAGGFGRRP